MIAGCGEAQGNPVRIRLTLLIMLAFVPFAAEARIAVTPAMPADTLTPFEVSQRGCMSLNDAINSVRRRGDVQRILDANTRVEVGREVHHIKYMTKDGTVRTTKVNGCRR